jgi:hypothetical protein
MSVRHRLTTTPAISYGPDCHSRRSFRRQPSIKTEPAPLIANRPKRAPGRLANVNESAIFFGFNGRVFQHRPGCLDPVELQGFSAIDGLHLCKAAIHKQFRSRDVAAVVGCEKHHGFGDLVGRAEPAERNSVGNHLQAFLPRFPGSQQTA